VIKSEATFTERGTNAIDVSYLHKEFSGKGSLVALAPFDSYKSGVFAGANYLEGLYDKPLEVGDVYSRCAVLLGNIEEHIEYSALLSLAERGYEKNFVGFG
jgi:hypothetical protein